MRFLSIALLLLSQSIYAQFSYTFNSFPDSAEVYVNDKFECYTPCRVNYFWRDAVDGKLVFSLKAEEYQSWADTLRSKPNSFYQSEKVFLEPDYSITGVEESPVIDFDKLLVEFENGKLIGEKISKEGEITQFKWEGSIKVGDEFFRNKFIEIATNMGFNTVISEESKLFASDKRRENKLPRFIVGVEIDEYEMQMRQEKKKKRYADGDVKVSTDMAFSWKVLDKRSGNIVYEYQNKKHLNSRQYFYQTTQYYADVYELALIDFLQSEGFRKLIENGGERYHTVDSTEERSVLTLEPVVLPDFENLSEMIKYANQSCVTIITDGGHGSGVMISDDGLLLSAYHVVEGVNRIDVKFSSGLTLKAEILDFDKSNDIVILKVQGSGFQSLPISPDAEYLLGAEVITIGTPADVELGQSVSKGILSGKRKNDNRVYWQVDMAVSPGNSGGPLLNEKGEIIGIIQSKIVLQGVEGIGFALPVSRLKDVFKIQL